MSEPLLIELGSTLQLIFPGPESESTRAMLLASGFRWSMGQSAWIRHNTSWAREKAKFIISLNSEAKL